MQTEILSLRIFKAEIRALRAKARQERVSQGSLVRRALRAYGVSPETDPGRRGYDVIKHLIGKNRGSAKDLSTNPKHLAHYGS
jgi:hypothetical protein